MSRVGLVRGGAFFAVLVAAPLLGLEHWVINMLIVTLMFATTASAWNLVGGFAGYPSLGHAAFYGIGAYTLAIMVKGDHLTSGYEPFILLPVVGLVGAAIGWPIAAISMRTRSDVFAIVTITLLFVVQTLAFNLRSLTGGAQGIALPIPPFPAATFERPYYFVMVVLLAFAMGVTWFVMHSKLGLSLVSIRADEDKARGIGVRVTGIKILAFCVSVGIVTMVGGVYAYYQSFIYPQFAVDPLVTIAMVLMTFLGGRGTLWGPVVGAFILGLSQQYLAYHLGASQFYLIAYALVFLVIMLLLPRGILPTISDRLRRRRRTRAARAADQSGSPSIALTASASATDTTTASRTVVLPEGGRV